MKYLDDQVDKTRGIDYIFMEYCNSGNIEEYVTKNEINEKFVWTFIMKVSRALASFTVISNLMQFYVIEMIEKA